MSAQDAIILAGEKEGCIQIEGTHKAFLPLQGKPLIHWVVSALDRCRAIRSMTIVGPVEKFAAALQGVRTEKPVRFLQQGENIFDNLWRGALSTFPEYRHGMTADDLRHSPQADKPVTIITCDVPLLEPVEVDHFLDTAPLDRGDIVFGVTRQEILAPFEPQEGKPGIAYIYFCVREGLIRHSNIMTMRPLKLSRLMEKQIPLIYRFRYQRYFRNVIPLMVEFLRFYRAPQAIYYFLLLQAAKNFNRHGWLGARDRVRRSLPLPQLERQFSNVIQTRFVAHETLGPGPTLDVDDEDSYRAFVENFDEWKALQREQIQAALRSAGPAGGTLPARS